MTKNNVEFLPVNFPKVGKPTRDTHDNFVHVEREGMSKADVDMKQRQLAAKVMRRAIALLDELDTGKPGCSDCMVSLFIACIDMTVDQANMSVADAGHIFNVLAEHFSDMENEARKQLNASEDFNIDNLLASVLKGKLPDIDKLQNLKFKHPSGEEARKSDIQR